MTVVNVTLGGVVGCHVIVALVKSSLLVAVTLLAQAALSKMEHASRYK